MNKMDVIRNLRREVETCDWPNGPANVNRLAIALGISWSGAGPSVREMCEGVSKLLVSTGVSDLDDEPSDWERALGSIARRVGASVEGCDSQDAEERIDEALDRRLMPEVMEWPRFEDGAPVRFGDKFLDHQGNERSVLSIKMWKEGAFEIGTGQGTYDWHSAGERIRRPAPKVLDADGVEIRVGDTVWTTNGLGPFEVTCIVNADQLRVICDDEENGHLNVYPQSLTHRAPVLAADGRPLREGETVWHEDGTELRVVRFGHEEDGEALVEVERVSGPTDWDECRSLSLTHQRPVLDADGVPIKAGDTVWMVDDPDGPYKVTKVTTKYATHVHGYSNEFGDLDMSPSQLTHERPDSWDRLEDDATKPPYAYCVEHGLDDDSFPTNEKFARDLVRRARVLAERSE